MHEQGSVNVESSYEDAQDDVQKIELPEIETWTNQYYSKREYEISIESGNGELSSICPKTNLPDFATLYLTYTPNEKCIELKSFKEYLCAYRDVGIFHEHLANRILDDLVKACAPLFMHVKIQMNPRGNIITIVDAKYSDECAHAIKWLDNINKQQTMLDNAEK